MRLRTAPFTASLLILLGGTSLIRSQESGYLSQKLLLENTIQQRITNAISKILDESQFVVNVKIELAFTPAREVETVYRTPDGRLIEGREPSARDRRQEGAEPGEEAERDRRTVVSPFPIPGFPDVMTEIEEPVRPLDEEEPARTVEEALTGEESVAGAAGLTETTTEAIGGLPRVIAMAISIILEDGVSPQIIENVRHVAQVASRFDPDRDSFSITTASFKDRRPTGELATTGAPVTRIQIDQVEALEEKLQEVQVRNEELMKELRNRELEYLQRSEEERKQALANLAQVQNERAKDLIFLQQQREEQNARLQEALLTQIDEMRKDLTSGRLPPDEQDITSLQVSSLEDSLSAMRLAFESEKERLQSQIEATLTREPPPPQGFAGLSGSTLLILLGVILLVVLVGVAIFLVTVRSRPQVAPAGMVYPGPVAPPYPRRRPAPRATPAERAKKKVKPRETAEEAKPEKKDAAPPVPEKEEAAPKVEAEPAPAAEVSAPKAAEPAPSQVEDDPEVLRSEIKSIRQSVVSMGVGRPESATRIMSGWLQQDEETPEEVSSEEKEEDSGVAAALRGEKEEES